MSCTMTHYSVSSETLTINPSISSQELLNHCAPHQGLNSQNVSIGLFSKANSVRILEHSESEILTVSSSLTYHGTGQRVRY